MGKKVLNTQQRSTVAKGRKLRKKNDQPEAEDSGPASLKAANVTQTCGCCGRSDDTRSMIGIDSGQLLCPECLKELRQK